MKEKGPREGCRRIKKPVRERNGRGITQEYTGPGKNRSSPKGEIKKDVR